MNLEQSDEWVEIVHECPVFDHEEIQRSRAEFESEEKGFPVVRKTLIIF